MNEKIREAFEGAATTLECSIEDLKGMTLNQVFNECESIGNVTVFWGFWNKEELSTIL